MASSERGGIGLKVVLSTALSPVPSLAEEDRDDRGGQRDAGEATSTCRKHS